MRLLGDPTRPRALSSLAEPGELCVCDLAAVVDAPDTSVSHTLRLLRVAGVVPARRPGRTPYDALQDARVRLVLAVVSEHLPHGAGG